MTMIDENRCVRCSPRRRTGSPYPMMRSSGSHRRRRRRLEGEHCPLWSPVARWGRAALVAAAVVIVVGGVTLIERGAGNFAGAPIRRRYPSPVAPAPRARCPPPLCRRFAQRQAPVSSGSSSTSAGVGSAAERTHRRNRPSAGRIDHVSPAPLPSGIVGQPAKVVTTGTIDLALGSNPLEPAVNRLTTIAIGPADSWRSPRPAGTVERHGPGLGDPGPPGPPGGVLHRAHPGAVDRQGHVDVIDFDRRHGSVRRPPSPDRRAAGEPTAVPHHSRQGHLDQRHPGRPEPARHHPEPDRAAAGPARSPGQPDDLCDR